MGTNDQQQLSGAGETVGREEGLKALQGWMSGFKDAVASGDDARLAELFTANAYWREVLALTWNISFKHGPAAIAPALKAALKQAKATGFEIQAETTIRFTNDAAGGYVEGFFLFSTPVGKCRGHLRLRRAAPGSDIWKAWTFMTSLQEIDGHPELVGDHRPNGMMPMGKLWAEERKRQLEFRDREPQVVIIGAAHSGLGIAARCDKLGMETLTIEKTPRVGDSWRNRYRSLFLHNETWSNHLPYMPFPKSWPLYTSKDKLGDWLESYANALDLNIWTSSVIKEARFDDASGRWELKIKRGEEIRTVRPKHVVLATGVFGEPRTVELQGADKFGGTIIRSQDYQEGGDVKDKKVLVIGTGSSAHDIAMDLSVSGADVTILQRSSTCVLSLKSSYAISAARYNEAGQAPDILEDLDTAGLSVPMPLLTEFQKATTKKYAEEDRDLHAALERRGFRIDHGTDGSGFLLKYYRQGGGYYFDMGASQLIVQGKIKVKNGVEVRELQPGKVVFTDGDTQPFDMIVAALGFDNMQETVRKMFGDQVAGRVGPIWGMGEDEELRGMWRPTGQRGFWVHGSSLVQSRVMSKVLALRILGEELGLVK